MTNEKTSLLDLIDNTLGELGLPGLKSILLTPQEILDILGLPSIDKIAEGVKSKLKERARRL